MRFKLPSVRMYAYLEQAHPEFTLTQRRPLEDNFSSLGFPFSHPKEGWHRSGAQPPPAPCTTAWVQLHQAPRFRVGTRRKRLDVGVKAPGCLNPRVMFTPKRKKLRMPYEATGLIPTPSRLTEACR